MDVDGLEELLRSYERSVEEFEENANTLVQKEGVKLIAKVKPKTPVDTGQLRRSWQIEQHSNNEVEVFNNTEYALNMGHVKLGKIGKH